MGTTQMRARAVPPWPVVTCIPASGSRRVLLGGSADQPAAEAVGDGLSTVAHAELAEQPAGVGLDRVLGEVELAADLAVALALAHPAQNLKLPLGELNAGVGGLARRRHRGAGEGVRQRGDQLGARRVPSQVATRATG